MFSKHRQSYYPIRDVIYFFAPAAKNRRTGGYIYNDSIAILLREKLELTYKFVPDDELEETVAILARSGEEGAVRSSRQRSAVAAVIIFDSLYFLSGDIFSRVLECCRHGNLKAVVQLHYLPSMNPFLEAAESARLQYQENNILRRAHGIVSVSDYMKKELIRRGIDDTKIGICEPGIDEELLALGTKHPGHGGRERSLNLLTIANASRLKGLDWLLDILIDINDCPWQWRVVGAMNRQSRLSVEYGSAAGRANAACASQSGRIVLDGSVERTQLRTKYREADLLLFPSFSESYGMVVADALAAGVPVIANRVGAVPQLVKNRETGYLCDPGNRDQWSAALKRLLTDDEERSRLAKNALSCRESLPRWRGTAEKYIAFLKSFKRARMV